MLAEGHRVELENMGKKGLRRRLDTFLHGKTTDRRKARLLRRSTTGSLKLVRRGPIGARIAFISTFWPGGNGRLTPFALAAALAGVGFSPVLIVTAGRMPDFDAVFAKLAGEGAPLGDATVVWRRNLGRDFGGYKDAFHFFGDELSAAERVFLGNDGLIGPLFPSDYFQRLQQSGPGLWGATESFDHAYHLQSSHLLFSGRDAVEAARAFFRQYDFYDHRANVIRYGELELSQWFVERHIPVTPYYPAELLAAEKKCDTVSGRKQGAWYALNAQHYYFDTLMSLGCPFVKRELLALNPLQLPDLYERVFAQMEQRGQSADLLYRHLRPL